MTLWINESYKINKKEVRKMISTLRTATEVDIEKIEKSASRFVTRHGLNCEKNYADLESELECMYDEDKSKYLKKLWIACFRRAVESNWADCMAYGHIGKSM